MGELEIVVVATSIIVAIVAIVFMLMSWLDFHAAKNSALREADRGIALFEALAEAARDGDDARYAALLAQDKR